MATRRALRALIDGTIRRTPERLQLPHGFDDHAPQLYLLPLRILGAYDALLTFPVCLHANAPDGALHAEVQHAHQQGALVLREISAAMQACARARVPQLDGAWWRDFMHQWATYLALLRELARRLRDEGTGEGLAWLMRACPGAFWDTLWEMLLRDGCRNAAFLDLLCAPPACVLRRGLEASQASRDACVAGFERRYHTDESLGQEGVRRVLESTGLVPVPLPEALGADTRAGMRA